MDYPSPIITELLEYFDRLPVRLTIVDNHRQVQFAGQLQLFAEPPHLHVFRRKIPEEIEPDFTVSDNPLTFCQLCKEIVRKLINPRDIMRMHPHGGVDLVVPFREGNRLPAVLEVQTNRDDAGDTLFPCPSYNIFPLTIKFIHLKMGVRIN